MINQSKQTKDALLDSQYLRDFFEHAPVGLHVFGPDRKIIDINRAELDLIGYEREEVVARKDWSDLIIEEQKPQFERHWEAINAKGEVANFHYTLVHKDGHHVDVLLNASARFDAQGKLINTRGIVFDISREINKEISAPTLSLIEQKKLLEQKNLVLNQLLLRIEMERNRILENVSSTVMQLTAPLLKKLRRKGSPIDQRYIDLLEKSLRTLTSQFATKISHTDWELSGREKEICHMIKEGLSSKEIAGLLSASIRTVDNHRNHIRKKLGISRKSLDLTTYLRSWEI